MAVLDGEIWISFECVGFPFLYSSSCMGPLLEGPLEHSSLDLTRTFTFDQLLAGYRGPRVLPQWQTIAIGLPAQAKADTAAKLPPVHPESPPPA